MKDELFSDYYYTVAMVHIKPDLEAGTAEERAEVPPPPAQYDHYAEDTDEEPDVEDIEVGDSTMIST